MFVWSLFLLFTIIKLQGDYMIETRIKQIFDYLTLDYDYHSSKDIAETMGLSSKTVRKEIQFLNSKIKNKGAIVESKPGKGFIFIIKDEEKFKDFLKNEWYKYAYFQQESGSKDLRYENILKIFLFSNSYVKQYELAEIFHVSESLINKDLPYIREILKKYDLDLISKPYYGMKVKGSEKNIRLAIKNAIGEDPNLFNNEENRQLFLDIQEIIDNIDFGDDFYMSYASFKNLVVHIYISILRIKEGKIINLSEDTDKKLISYEEFKIANKIVYELQDKLDMNIPHQELVYITMHLIAKNTITDQEKISTDILNLSREIIEEIYKISRYDFRSDIGFYFALAVHLGPLLNRLKYGFTMKNPILKDIKDNKLAFMLAAIGANVINKKFKVTLSDDEIGYIALHVMAAINNDDKSKKKKLLIVCGSGNSSAQIMKAQLLKTYKNNIEKIDISDLRSLDVGRFDNYDLIISSVRLDVESKSPIVYVDILFTPNDLDNIRCAIKVDDLEEMRKLFDRSIFIKNSKLNSKEDVLEFIAEEIEKKSNFDKNLALAQLKSREKMGQTCFDNIAIPHILDQVKGDSYSIIITMDKAIKWDEKSVSLIYSLVIGDNVGDMNLFYQKLGSFLANDELVNLASKSENKADFVNIFLKEK